MLKFFILTLCVAIPAVLALLLCVRCDTEWIGGLLLAHRS